MQIYANVTKAKYACEIVVNSIIIYITHNNYSSFLASARKKKFLLLFNLIKEPLFVKATKRFTEHAAKYYTKCIIAKIIYVH